MDANQLILINIHFQCDISIILLYLSVLSFLDRLTYVPGGLYLLFLNFHRTSVSDVLQLQILLLS